MAKKRGFDEITDRTLIDQLHPVSIILPSAKVLNENEWTECFETIIQMPNKLHLLRIEILPCGCQIYNGALWFEYNKYAHLNARTMMCCICGLCNAQLTLYAEKQFIYENIKFNNWFSK